MPLSKTKQLIWSGVGSIIFMGVTYILGMELGVEFFMLFHIIPWGIGFSGGESFWMIVYYLLFFLIVFGGIYGFQRLLVVTSPKDNP